MGKIKVGHLRYEVRPMDARFVQIEGGNDNFVGLHDPAELVIYICPNLAPADQVRVLLHELIHAFHHAYTIRKADRKEEDICLALEQPLAALLIDNPRLMDWAQAAAKGRPLVRNGR